MSKRNIIVRRSTLEDRKYAEILVTWYEQSAAHRGTGIARRSSHYVQDRIASGHAVIAISDNHLCGFCYVETWSHGEFVANSGLIVHPDYRALGLGKQIKHQVFHLARTLYPTAKVFGITTSNTVMHINSGLGYQPVAFEALPRDKAFWKGCSSCPNYDILSRTDRKYCLCTAMIAPSAHEEMSHSLTPLILNNHEKK